jgi:hypothetical protein
MKATTRHNVPQLVAIKVDVGVCMMPSRKQQDLHHDHVKLDLDHC